MWIERLNANWFDFYFQISYDTNTSADLESNPTRQDAKQALNAWSTMIGEKKDE